MLNIGKREDPGSKVEIEVLSASISTAFFSVKNKTGNCIFFIPRFEFLILTLSFPVRQTPKVYQKKKINNPLVNEMNV